MTRGTTLLLSVLAAGLLGACSLLSTDDGDLTSRPPVPEAVVNEQSPNDASADDRATSQPPGDGSDGGFGSDAHRLTYVNAADADAGPICPGTGGPTGVRVGSYCIDSTEVTNDQYLAYLKERKGDTSGQPPQCGWNTGTYALQPLDPWPVPVGQEQFAVVGVDWCDAFAFCAYYGKRLCGRIGGGSITIDEYQSQDRVTMNVERRQTVQL